MFRQFQLWWTIIVFFALMNEVYADISLLAQLKAIQHDSSRLRIYTALAQEYRIKKNIDSMLIYTKLGLGLAKKLNDSQYHCNLYTSQSFYYFSKSQYELAIQIAQMAIGFGKKNKQYAEAELAAYLLVVIYSDKAYLSGKAKDQIATVRQIYENIRFSYQYHSFTKIDHHYSLLSSIYKNYGDDSLAYFYLKKYLRYVKKNEKDTQSQLIFLVNSIDLALYEKSYNKAKHHLNQILKFKPYKKDVDFYLYIMSDIVATYIKFKDYNQAFALIREIQNDQALTSKMAIYWRFRFYNDLTTIYLHQKNYNKAQQAYENATNFLKNVRIGNQDHLKILINQQNLFEHQKRFEEALALNKRINSMQDSLASAQYSFELAASEERLAHQNKERLYKQQIQIQQLENDVKTKSLIKAKETQVLALVAIVFLILVMLIIGLQLQKILKQAKALKVLNANKNRLFAIIGHDLRSPILALQSSMMQLGQQFSEVQKQLPRINNLLLTIDNLLYWANSQQEKSTVNIQQIELSEIIDDVLALLDASIEQAGLEIRNDVPELVTVKADENHLKIIVRNIIQNAIKFTPKNGTIALYVNQLPNQVVLFIQDTGIGIEQSEQVSTKKGTHLGLRLVQQLIKINNGEFTIDASSSTGTRIRLNLQK